MSKNYYDILEVDKTATIDDIKKSYKKLARQYHPDLNPNDKESEEKFREIVEAYETLSDEEKRKEYDWKQSVGSRGFDSFGFSNFGDFSGFGGFEGFNFSKRVERGDDIHVDVDVTIEEIYHKKEITFKYSKKIPCKKCNGNGAEDNSIRTCPVCNGKGSVIETHVSGNTIYQTQHHCYHCNGKGTIIDNPCKECNGSGFEVEETTGKLTLKNLYDNSTIRIQGKGSYPKDKNGISGDLYVTFHIKKDDYFTIENGYLVRYEEVAIEDCLLGCERIVRTVNGDEKTIILEELTENNKQFIFNDCGMWNKPYIVVIKHKLPQSLTDKQKELLKEFKNEQNIPHT
jgi:molecular chaperone DnaJ